MTRIEKILRKCSRKQLICAILGICIAMILTTKIVGRRMAYVEAKYQDTQQALAGGNFISEGKHGSEGCGCGTDQTVGHGAFG